ncbi:MAG: bacteriohemerythrin [Solirubrobacterales bacterium]
MDFPRWTNDLTVYHQAMDEQHQRLFVLAEALARSSGQGDAEIDARVNELIDYTYTHFASEEAFLIQIGYPHFRSHKQQHEAIFRAVDQIVEKYANLDRRLFVDELAIFVAEWLVRHILDEDMAYARFIADNRMRRSTDITAAPQPPDPVDRLRRLKAALDEGLIGRDEFDAQRRRILGDF